MAVTSLYRTGSANTYDNAIQNIEGRQSKLSQLQEQLTSGKRVVRPSDDPTAAAQAERSITRMERIKADQRALEQQKNAIAMGESTLGDITTALQSFRELAVSAGNGTHTAAERKTIANQLSGMHDQILELANRTDTNGRPLFAALGSALAPFVGPLTTAPDYTFNGLPGQESSTAISIPFALDGDSAFMHNTVRDGVYNVSIPTATSGQLTTSPVTLTHTATPTGSTYAVSIASLDTTTTPGTTIVNYSVLETTAAGATLPAVTGTSKYPTPTSPSTTAVSFKIPDPAGTLSSTTLDGLTMTVTGIPTAGDSIKMAPSASVFSTMDNAIRDIGSAANNNAASQAVGQALGNIDTAMARLSMVRGVAGDLLNRADTINSNQDKRSIQLEADRSRAEDLDMIKGVSEFQNQQTGYQAALQSYAQVQKLSLFNFIS